MHKTAPLIVTWALPLDLYVCDGARECNAPLKIFNDASEVFTDPSCTLNTFKRYTCFSERGVRKAHRMPGLTFYMDPIRVLSGVLLSGTDSPNTPLFTGQCDKKKKKSIINVRTGLLFQATKHASKMPS